MVDLVLFILERAESSTRGMREQQRSGAASSRFTVRSAVAGRNAKSEDVILAVAEKKTGAGIRLREYAGGATSTTP